MRTLLTTPPILRVTTLKRWLSSPLHSLILRQWADVLDEGLRTTQQIPLSARWLTMLLEDLDKPVSFGRASIGAIQRIFQTDSSRVNAVAVTVLTHSAADGVPCINLVSTLLALSPDALNISGLSQALEQILTRVSTTGEDEKKFGSDTGNGWMDREAGTLGWTKYQVTRLITTFLSQPEPLRLTLLADVLSRASASAHAQVFADQFLHHFTIPDSGTSFEPKMHPLHEDMFSIRSSQDHDAVERYWIHTVPASVWDKILTPVLRSPPRGGNNPLISVFARNLSDQLPFPAESLPLLRRLVHRMNADDLWIRQTETGRISWTGVGSLSLRNQPTSIKSIFLSHPLREVREASIRLLASAPAAHDDRYHIDVERRILSQSPPGIPSQIGAYTPWNPWDSLAKSLQERKENRAREEAIRVTRTQKSGFSIVFPPPVTNLLSNDADADGIAPHLFVSEISSSPLSSEHNTENKTPNLDAAHNEVPPPRKSRHPGPSQRRVT